MSTSTGIMGVAVEAIEYYLPSNIEDGVALKKEKPDWSIDDIELKTGISTRYISNEGETALDLAVFSAEKLFTRGVDRKKINSLIFVTQSPDYVLPASACIIQERLGLNIKCLAFDVNQGCSGFVYGLAVGASLIESGIVDNALLLCGETYTKYIDKNDRTNRPVFSDGAAAALLTRSPFGRLGPFEFGSDGSGAKNLIVESSGARKNDRPLGDRSQCKLFMDGSQVLMFSMREVPKCVTALLEKSGRGIGEIDLFIFHQASKLVIDNVARHLKLSEEKIFRNYQRIGNTVSASIPIALSDAEKEGRLKTGDLVMLVGFGVGYSWGACLMNWAGHV